MTTGYAPKSLGRAYAFKFLYALMHPKSSEDKKTLLESEDFAKDLATAFEQFDSSYFEPDEEHLQNGMLSPKVLEFSRELIEKVLLQEEQLKKIIRPYLKRRTLEQLDRVELTVLLMSTLELKEFSGTPAKVVMNEAIELSKQYGSKESGPFINGILDPISKKYAE
jgi:N utilization substance protein B